MTKRHGKFTMGESVLYGTLAQEVALDWIVKLDGNDHDEKFWLLKKLWTFTPDPEPLPTEPGTVFTHEFGGGLWAISEDEHMVSLESGKRYKLSGIARQNFHVVSRPVKEES